MGPVQVYKTNEEAIMDEDAGKQKVIIFTHQFEIRGDLNIYQGVRLTDYMNESKAFISVTNVKIKDSSGERRLKARFLNVRKEDIEMIIPEDSVISSTLL
jgi:hypothetical protein